MKIPFSQTLSYTFLLFLFLGNSQVLTAQEIGNQVINIPGYVIGFTPTSLVNSYPKIQLTQDIKLSPKWNANLETAYVLRSIYSEMLSGYRIKAGVEYNYKSNGKHTFFHGVNLLYRSIDERRESIVNINSSNTFIPLQYNRYNRIYGLQFSLGRKLSITERILFKSNLNFGLARVVVENQDVDTREMIFVSSLSDEWIFPELSIGRYILPVAAMQFSFTYALLN